MNLRDIRLAAGILFVLFKGKTMSEKIEKDTLKVNYGPIFSKGYGRLFYYLFFNPMLDHTARAVLVYISALLPSSNDLLAWPGVQKIKEVTGAGIHQVQEALNQLEELGIIKIRKIKWKRKNNMNSFDHNEYEVLLRPKNFCPNPDPQYQDYGDARDYGYKDLPLLPILDERIGVKEIIMWGLVCALKPAKSLHCTIDEKKCQEAVGLSANPYGKKTGQQQRALEMLRNCGYIDFKYDAAKKSNNFCGSYEVSILNDEKEINPKERTTKKEGGEKPKEPKVSRKSTTQKSTTQKSTAQESTAQESTANKILIKNNKIIKINQSGRDRITRLIEESLSFDNREKKLLESLLKAVYGGHGELIVRNKKYEYEQISSQLESLTDSEIIQMFVTILVNSAKHRNIKNRISYLIACLVGEYENKEESKVNLRSNRNIDYNALAMQELMEKLQN